MPIYQVTSVDSDKLVLGNAKVERAASALATFSNLGAGTVTNWDHLTEQYTSQAGNAPDPVEGVASETVTVAFELIEFDASVLSAISGGLISASTSSSLETIHAGGNADTTISRSAYRFTNTRTISGATIETILTVYYATSDAGPSFQLKSDNDTDPVMIMPVAITGKLDTTRAAGQQLYTITHDVPA